MWQNNSLIRAADEKVEYTPKMLKEIIKCKEDIIYFNQPTQPIKVTKITKITKITKLSKELKKKRKYFFPWNAAE